MTANKEQLAEALNEQRFLHLRAPEMMGTKDNPSSEYIMYKAAQTYLEILNNRTIAHEKLGNLGKKYAKAIGILEEIHEAETLDDHRLADLITSLRPAIKEILA